MDKARESAMKILYKTEFEDAYVNMALKEEFRKNKELSLQDKAFVTNLVYGTVKRSITIDYIIECFSKIKLSKISKYILIILRLGIYQIKFMDKVPESAAVNESVELAKRYGHKASSGFVNGILRNVLREEIVYPENPEDRLCITYSFPKWICQKWISDYGKDFSEALMEAMNKDVNMCLRVNTLKTTADKILEKLPSAYMSEICDCSIYSAGFDIENNKYYKEGYFTPQDISASLASIVLDPKRGEKVLDICAAPGGKTTHIAELMKNEGEITACDVYEHKLELIEKNAMRLGIDIIDTVCMDATVKKAEFAEKFDKVLADVPCSGLGIIRRKPDIKLKKEAENLTDIQYKILENAAIYLKCGGEIVYSTCTLNKEENEEIIEKFLKHNKGYKRVDVNKYLPEILKKAEGKKGYVTFFPNIDNIDGFFIAKLKKGE